MPSSRPFNTSCLRHRVEEEVKLNFLPLAKSFQTQHINFSCFLHNIQPTQNLITVNTKSAHSRLHSCLQIRLKSGSSPNLLEPVFQFTNICPKTKPTKNLTRLINIKENFLRARDLLESTLLGKIFEMEIRRVAFRVDPPY